MPMTRRTLARTRTSTRMNSTHEQRICTRTRTDGGAAPTHARNTKYSPPRAESGIPIVTPRHAEKSSFAKDPLAAAIDTSASLATTS
eukprot:6174168-Pleurochrysis_carterae.AAC.2